MVPSSERLWLSCFTRLASWLSSSWSLATSAKYCFFTTSIWTTITLIELRTALRSALIFESSCFVVGDLPAHVRLHGGDLGDRGLLVGDLLGQCRLLRLGVGELVRVDRGDAVRGRGAEHAEQHRDEEKEGEPTEASRVGPGA